MGFSGKNIICHIIIINRILFNTNIFILKIKLFLIVCILHIYSFIVSYQIQIIFVAHYKSAIKNCCMPSFFTIYYITAL